MPICDCTIPGSIENMSRIHLLQVRPRKSRTLAAFDELKINVVHKLSDHDNLFEVIRHMVRNLLDNGERTICRSALLGLVMQMSCKSSLTPHSELGRRT